jgi:hypothetical protein
MADPRSPQPEAAPATDGAAPAVDTPILLLVFNRPEYTLRVLERLREVRPARLYVAADGPRPGKKEDPGRCEAVRQAIDGIDWPCKVRRLFQDRNLGCKRGVETGIDWFFEQVDSGIILEDDCVPDPTFFPFTQSMLQRYANDERVMMVSGTNRVGRWDRDGCSYHFSRHGVIWGWATWRRAWAQHDRTLAAWEDPSVRAHVARLLGPEQYGVCAPQFEAVRRGQLDTWDYGWMFTVMRHGLAVVPSVNLITNIGFGQDATHTFNEFSSGANLETQRMQFPLRHPAAVEPDVEYDAHVVELARPRFRLLQRLLPDGAKRRALLTLSRVKRLRR